MASSQNSSTNTSTNTSTSPVLYQVDCSKASSGKKVAITKRRIRWRYGFANPSTLTKESTCTSVQCRGEEHEITFVWSIASGKKLVVHDQQEIHYSQGNSNSNGYGRGSGGKRSGVSLPEGKFHFCWKRGDHVFTLLAHAAPPLGNKKAMGWKQFDLLIDGHSFDNLPRIYQLGTDAMITSMNHSARAVGPHVKQYINASASVRFNRRDKARSVSVSPTNSHTSTPAYGNGNYFTYDEEVRSPQNEMAWARSMHSIETKRHMNSHSHSSTSSNTNPPSATQQQPAVDLLSCDMCEVLDSPRDLMSEQVPTLEYTPTSSTGSSDPFEYSDQNDQFDPNVAPSYDVIWSDIMDAYDTNNLPATATATMPVQSTCVTQVPTTYPSKHDHNHNLTINTTENNDPKYAPNVVSPTDVTEMDAMGAMNHLVNLDDISQPVLKEYDSNKDVSLKEERAKELRRHLSLAEIKKGCMNTGAAGTGKKEIMKTHQEYYQNHPGALVVYGQGPGLGQPQTSYGPPPLGFGMTMQASYR